MSTTTSTSTSTEYLQGLHPAVSSPVVVPLKSYAHLPGSSSSAAVASNAVPSSSSAVSTLRSLYPRAARALLQRDIPLVHTLLDSAFALISPPSSFSPDTLDTHRRKWDILRITLETSVFANPHAAGLDYESLPSPLRKNLLLSAQSLVAALHARSVRLFAPTSASCGPRAAYLPAQILVALILSSLKLHCPDVGRSMIEDWLAQRETVEKVRDDAEGYERIVELFCLHVLPRLQDWEYASGFLAYERDLSPQTRLRFNRSLDALRKREIESARTLQSSPPLSTPSPNESNSTTPDRSPSPAPSSDSSSSADTIDTHSTRTVVPRWRSNKDVNSLVPLSATTSPLPSPPPSTSSLHDSRSSYANGNAVHHETANGHALQGKGKHAMSPPAQVAGGVISHTWARGAAARSDPINEVGRETGGGGSPQRDISAYEPSLLTLVRSSLRPYLKSVSTSHIIFVLLFVLAPLFSLLIRRRRRRAAAVVGGPAASSVAEDVRRRLTPWHGGAAASVLSMVWKEVLRAVVDAVRMAIGGLV